MTLINGSGDYLLAYTQIRFTNRLHSYIVLLLEFEFSSVKPTFLPIYVCIHHCVTGCTSCRPSRG